MVGWVIQLFTLNLTFDSEAFIRLAHNSSKVAAKVSGRAQLQAAF